MSSQKSFLIVIFGQTYSPSSPGRPFTGPCGLVAYPHTGDRRVPNYEISKTLTLGRYRNFLSSVEWSVVRSIEARPRVRMIESKFMVDMVSAFDDFPVPNCRIYIKKDGTGSRHVCQTGDAYVDNYYGVG